MKSKLLSFAIFSLFLLSLASAFTISPTSITFSDNDAKTFTITNTNASELLDVSFSTLTITGESGVATFAISGSSTGINTTRTITITPTIDFTDFDFGTDYTGELIITNNDDSSDTKTLTVNIETDYCNYDDNGNLRVSIEDITNNGIGEDDNWYLMDEIEIEVNVDNRGDEKIEDIKIEWCLYDEDSKTCLMSDDEKSFDLKDGKDETVIITLNLDEDIESFDDGSYNLLVKASGDDTEFDPSEMTCNSASDSIDIMIDDDFVVLTDIEVTESVQCEGTVDISARVWNIGEEDQDDVYVKIINNQLGIFEKVEIGDIDSLEDEKLSFSFTIPSDALEKKYTLEFSVYDEDDDLYESSNDDDSVFNVEFEVSGGCELANSAELTAVLDSEAIAGKDLVIKSNIKNTGTQQTTYHIFIKNYEEWAELDSISQETLVLNAGETKEFTINLIPDKKSEGEKQFMIQAISDGNIEEQIVIVTLEPSQGVFSGISISSGNWVIWIIAALNIILVLLIIIVAVRVARKS